MHNSRAFGLMYVECQIPRSYGGEKEVIYTELNKPRNFDGMV